MEVKFLVFCYSPVQAQLVACLLSVEKWTSNLNERPGLRANFRKYSYLLVSPTFHARSAERN